MKSIKQNIYKPAICFFLLLLPIITTAQDFGDGDGDGDDVNDEAPIDGYVTVTLIAGCVLGYILIKRETKLS